MNHEAIVIKVIATDKLSNVQTVTVPSSIIQDTEEEEYFILLIVTYLEITNHGSRSVFRSNKNHQHEMATNDSTYERRTE